MTPQDYAALEAQLIQHEGLRLTLYLCTSGKLTWGVGYNVSDRGLIPLQRALGRSVTIEDLRAGRLTREDALTVLRRDIPTFEAQIRERLPRYDQLGAVRQRAIIDFVFNLGATRAAAFTSAIAAGRLALAQTDPRLAQACWDACAFHMMDSLWARQVDDGLGGKRGRADRVCHMIRTGVDPGPR
ncbi:MAG TPA: hypothetical protein VM364_00495 [Vicinamibacterales bacterium]|nr:hypothetical protein [Vicinamibacterales bacterium]